MSLVREEDSWPNPSIQASIRSACTPDRRPTRTPERALRRSISLLPSCSAIPITPRRFGAEAPFVRPRDLDAWRAAIRPNTKALFAETLGNPGLDVLDIPAVAAIAHAPGPPLMVDSPF